MNRRIVSFLYRFLDIYLLCFYVYTDVYVSIRISIGMVILDSSCGGTRVILPVIKKSRIYWNSNCIYGIIYELIECHAYTLICGRDSRYVMRFHCCDCGPWCQRYFAVLSCWRRMVGECNCVILYFCFTRWVVFWLWYDSELCRLYLLRKLCFFGICVIVSEFRLVACGCWFVILLFYVLCSWFVGIGIVPCGLGIKFWIL